MEEILRIFSKIVKGKGNSLETEHSTFYNYFIVPFSAGMSGFANFLFLILLFESIAYLVGTIKSLNLGLHEVYIAVLGFVLQFVYQLLKNFRESM
jgi:uncharacterized membrane protein